MWGPQYGGAGKNQNSYVCIFFVFGGIAVGRSWMNLRAYEVCEGIHSQLVVGYCGDFGYW